jgi:hypothetical protein
MYSQQEVYRQQILSRLQMWERELRELRNGIQKLDGDVRSRCEAWLMEVEARNRDVFNCYADLLAAEKNHWDEKRAALDAAAAQMETKIMDYVLRAA